MKMSFLLSLLALLSMASFAGERAELLFNGSNLSETLSLDSAVYRTEYRDERVRRTCYRRVCDQTRRVCRQQCRGQGERRRCRQVCHNENYCRNRAYTCYLWERVPYSVLDYYTEARLGFEFSTDGPGTYAEKFISKLRGDRVDLQIQDSGNNLIVLEQKEERFSQDRNTHFLDTNYKIKFFDISSFASAANEGIQQLRFKNQTISFHFNSFQSSFPANISVAVTRVKRLGSNRTIFNKVFSIEDLKQEDGSFALNLADHNVKAGKGRHRVNIKFSLVTSNLSIMNDKKTSKSVSKVFKR